MVEIEIFKLIMAGLIIFISFGAAFSLIVRNYSMKITRLESESAGYYDAWTRSIRHRHIIERYYKRSIQSYRRRLVKSDSKNAFEVVEYFKTRRIEHKQWLSGYLYAYGITDAIPNLEAFPEQNSQYEIITVAQFLEWFHS